MGRPRTESTRERPVPGSENYPADASELKAAMARIAQATGFDESQVRSVWPLVGTRAESILHECRRGERTNLPGTALPVAFVDWIIANEWVSTLDDLVERRLMLAWSAQLNIELLRTLARRLVGAGRLPVGEVEAAVAATRERLCVHYGRRL
jgi:glycerol-3-phosphate dehydrogenase